MFASHLNHKLPVYVFPLLDPQAWKENAFHILWDHLKPYTFLLFAVIQSIINKVMVSDGLSLIEVTPLCPHSEWFPDLLSLLVAEPLKLPRFWNLLIQPHVWKFHQGLDILHLHAWKFSSISSERWAFQRRLCKGDSYHRKLTSNLYQSKRSHFCHWCRGRGVDPCRTSVS